MIESCLLYLYNGISRQISATYTLNVLYIYRPTNIAHTDAAVRSFLTFISHPWHLLLQLLACPISLFLSFLWRTQNEAYFACLHCNYFAGIISLFFGCERTCRSCCDSPSDTQTECLTRRDHSCSQTNKARRSDAEPREFGSLLSRFAVKVKEADDYR